MNAEGAKRLLQAIFCFSYPIPAEVEVTPELERALDQALSTIMERQRQVLEWRFGLQDGKGKTQREIGLHFGVTRSRIAQIEQQALRRLRYHTRTRVLKAAGVRTTITKGKEDN